MNLRQERIERMLTELRYEVSVGMMQGEIDEHLAFTFIVPQSKACPGGVVRCRFETIPMGRQNAMYHGIEEPKLRIVT